MDRDELRRGGASLHVLAAREAVARGSSDAAHRGVAVTMLLGLLAQSMAFECLERAAAGAAARRWFDRVAEGVTLGQLLDVVAVDARDAGTAEIAAIHRLKTGLYTTEGPLVLGALLAGARDDGPEVAALRAWAGPVGEAFQLVDDILGIAGDPSETGKASGGDLREGKRTAVIEEALVRLPASARTTLQGLIGRGLDDAETARGQMLIDESGAVEAVRHRARGLADEARDALVGRSLTSSAVEALESLACLVVDRQN
jgi:geranylgeranyl diphosphate synthase type I